MTLSKGIVLFAALVAIYSSTVCLASPTEVKPTPNIRKYVTLGLQTLLKNGYTLQEVGNLVSTLADGSIEVPEGGLVDGSAYWGPTVIEYKSLEIPMPEFTDDAAAGTAMVMGDASIGSLLFKAPYFNMSLEMTDGSNSILRGENIQFGFSNFKAGLHAQGPFNPNSMSLDELSVSIALKFVGDGKVTINGDEGTMSSLAGQLDLLFSSVWNSCNSPKILNNLKCEINHFVRNCNSGNIAGLACVDLLTPSTCVPEQISLEACNSSGKLSVFNGLLLLLCLIVKFY